MGLAAANVARLMVAPIEIGTSRDAVTRESRVIVFSDLDKETGVT